MKKRPWIVKTKTIGQPRFEPFTSFLPCFTCKSFYHCVSTRLRCTTSQAVSIFLSNSGAKRMALRLQVKHQKMMVEQRTQKPKRMLLEFPERVPLCTVKCKDRVLYRDLCRSLSITISRDRFNVKKHWALYLNFSKG